jgi:hypothetical protein
LENYYIPVAKISERSLVTYSLPHIRFTRTEAQEKTASNLTRGVFKGEISKKAQRKVRATAENWILSIQEAKKQGKAHTGKLTRYVTFATLTLSAKQAHSDNVIKREVLNFFIINAVRHLNVREYLWRAESQANGNIHFHLFLDAYIPHILLRKEWNKAQERLGYISRFKEVYGHSNPNSTDIERIRSAKGAGIYISKYIAKDSKYRKIEGRLWGYSDGLQQIETYTTQADREHYSLISDLRSDATIKVIEGDHFTAYVGNIYKILASRHQGIYKEIKSHLIRTYCDTYP